MSLFRNHPGLVPELLQGALGVELPKWSELQVEASDFTQVVPTEYRADMVVLLKKRRPVFAGVVEVQLSRSSRKRRSWPVYLTSLQARLRCPVVLLVVAPDEAVARWCAKPIHLGHPGFVLQPLVVGPEAIPVLQGQQEKGQSAEMAVLSVLAHGKDAKLAPGLFEAVVSTVRGLEEERGTFYVDLALSAFGAAARSALEELMRSSIYEYQSEFARKYVAQGLRQGREEGREEGLQQGREEGHLEGERRALLKVLEARGLSVEGAARRRVLACTDLEQLERWLSRAVTVQSVQELFKPRPRSKTVGRAAGVRVRTRRQQVRR
ncbi:MAG TPA: hypothetical protein VNA24_05265 [Hyalangium sp.]|nr:hypothetical protein [Hyalangium sp.]